MATYRALIEPICPSLNLANIQVEDACQPCIRCNPVMTLDRGLARGNSLKTSYDVVDTFPDFPVLKASGKAGCGLCRILRKTIRQSWAVRPMDEEGVGQLSEGDGMWDDLLNTAWDRRVRLWKLSFHLEQRVGGQPHGGIITALQLDLSPASTPSHITKTGEQSQCGHIYRTLAFKAFDSADFQDDQPAGRRLPSRDTLSSENVRLMQGWIDTCKRDHAACRVPPTSWVPTRLLAIETAEDGSVCGVRLVETAALGCSSDCVPAVYAALSHMWGDLAVLPPLRTVKANYKAMQHGIRRAELPRNFVDAISTCARLHIPFLWIDSLCIVQDDGEDWNREAVLMHRVYRHAEATLVATSATSSHSGFLKRSLERIPAVKVSSRVTGTSSSPSSSSSSSPPTPGFMVLCPLDDRETGLVSGDVDGSRWNTRGWTLQERALSTRLIHFCQNKLYFECRCSLSSEEGEPMIQARRQVFQLWPRHVGEEAKSDKDARSLSLTSYYRQWQTVVSSYNGRDLTRDSDKLLAIRSIASEMEEAMDVVCTNGSRYIPFAGMWEGDLSTQLLWQTDVGPTRLPAETRAPSWSWASLNGMVTFKQSKRADTTEVPLALRDCFRVIDLGPLPSVGSGFLLLRSWVCSVSWIRYTEETDYWSLANRADRNFDILTRVRENKGSDGNDGNDQDREEIMFAHGRLDAKERGSSMLSLRSNELAYVHISNDNGPSGLLLRRVVGALPPGCPDCTWKRIGVATVYDSGGPFVPSLFVQNDKLQEVYIV